MAATKRNISEVARSNDNLQSANVLSGLTGTDAKPDVKMARDVQPSAKTVATPPEDSLDEDDIDGQQDNTDDGLSDDHGADENGATAQATIDLDAVPSHLGKPLTDFNINSEFKEGKPWLKPGADIADWFNYGFNESTWQRYIEKQRSLRGQFGQRPIEPQRLQTIGTMSSGGNSNFLNEIGGMFPRFNRPMMPMQHPPPFMMQMIQQQQQQMQMQKQQQMQMPQQQPLGAQQQQPSFPAFRPNMIPTSQPAMQGQAVTVSPLQTQQQGPMDMQNMAQVRPAFQQQGQTIMIRSQQPMNPGMHMQPPQTQRPPFNFNPGRMPSTGPLRHPTLFANNPNGMMINQQSQQSGLPVRPNSDQPQLQPPPPSGMQNNQPTGPPSVSGGPRRQLTSLTG